MATFEQTFAQPGRRFRNAAQHSTRSIDGAAAGGPAERPAGAELAEHRLRQRDVAAKGGVVAVVDQRDRPGCRGGVSAAQLGGPVDQDAAVPRRHAAVNVLKRRRAPLGKPVQVKGQAIIPTGLDVFPDRSSSRARRKWDSANSGCLAIRAR